MALESESKQKNVSECVVSRQILYYPQTIHGRKHAFLLR